MPPVRYGLDIGPVRLRGMATNCSRYSRLIEPVPDTFWFTLGDPA